MSPRALPTASAPTQGPVVLDRYRLVRRLGAGAFGTVWMAHDDHLDRDVAVKILPPERVSGGRFAREARAAARLAHPGIVTLYEAAVDEDGAYLVSQLILGDTLNALLGHGDLSDRDVVTVGIALCDALAHAHAHGIVHRDVKPSNVLIPEAPASAGEVAKLTDFGVARLIDAEQLTQTGDVVGTLAYMAPEQAGGQPAGPPADVYSLSLVLYEALTGVNPTARHTLLDARRARSPVPALRHQRRDLPRALGDALDLALRSSPGERAGLDELRAGLLASRPEVSDTPGVIEAPWSPLTRMTQRVRPPAAPVDPFDPRHPFDPLGPVNRLEPEPPGRAVQPDAIVIRPGSAVWPERAVGALGSAAIAAWVAAQLPLGLSPAPAGLVTAGLILLLPRLGWIVLVGAVAAGSLWTGRDGLALLGAGALLLAPFLLIVSPGLWGAAAGAPALGFAGPVGLAGAWPALAGQARTLWRRAGLGALGWIWLVAAGGLTHRILLIGRPLASRSPHAVSDSAQAVLHGLVAPVLRSGALIPAIAWAAGAGVLPWVVGVGAWRIRAVRGAIWAVAVAIAPGLILDALGPGHAPAPPGLVVGLLAGLLVVLVGSGDPLHRRRAFGGSQGLVVP